MVKDKDEWNARQWERRYERSGIPRRYWGMSLADLDGSDAVSKVAEYVEEIEEHRKNGRGLLLVGPPGTGKTTLACLVGLAAFEHEMSSAYVTMATFQRLLQEEISFGVAVQKVERGTPFGEDIVVDWTAAKARINRFRQHVQFLILDDVGKEHSTSTRFIEDSFDELVRLRYDLTLPTILTSNRKPDEWAAAYSDSMKSFLHEAFVYVPVLSGDRRRGTR